MFVCVCASSSCLEWSSSNSNSRNMLAVCLFYLLYATLYLFPFFFYSRLACRFVSTTVCVCVCSCGSLFLRECIWTKRNIPNKCLLYAKNVSYPTDRLWECVLFVTCLCFASLFFSLQTRNLLYITQNVFVSTFFHIAFLLFISRMFLCLLVRVWW